MQGNEKPRAWGNRQRGTNRESSCPDTTPKPFKNQLFESSKLRFAIDICADISSLTLLAYLLSRVLGVQP